MSSRIPVAIGDKFCQLTVVKLLPYRKEPSGRRRSWARTRCDCGNTHDVCTLQLTRGASKRCKQCANAMRSKLRIGDRFDRLTIVNFITVNKRRMAACTCDCGNTYTIRASLLTKTSTHSCGCRPRSSWTGIGDMSGTFFYRIKRNAKTRGYEFSVTQNYLWALFIEQEGKCAISGLPIVLDPLNNRLGNTTTASVDRIDNEVGYVAGNLHWVHKHINVMKLDHSLGRFVTLCEAVAGYDRDQ